MKAHLDTFSGSLGELPRGKRTIVHALRVLSDDPRVSTFERGQGWLELLLHELLRDGLVTEDTREPYPWHRFNITPAGRSALASNDQPQTRMKPSP